MSYNALLQDDVDATSDVEAPDTSIRSPPLSLESPPASPFYPLPPPVGTEDGKRIITRSREGSVPMRHPTPDLQSLQGAYTGNIERLERSAERLSMTSDIGEAIRQIGLEQRQSSSRRVSQANSPPDPETFTPSLQRQFSYGQNTHHSSSIVGTNSVARNGGFSASAYVPSPRGSLHSSSRSQRNSIRGRMTSQEPRLTQITEPALEGRPLDMATEASFVPLPPTSSSPLIKEFDLINDTKNLDQPAEDAPDVDHGAPEVPEAEPRASEDTFRQQAGMFSDFDGTHVESQPDTPPSPIQQEQPSRRASQLLQLDEGPREGMVYYPAPVPMMLNLPKKLSRQAAAMAALEKRRTVMPSPQQPHSPAGFQPEYVDRDSQSVSPDLNATGDRAGNVRALANLPPQLRATMFFDRPSERQDVEITGESAVATLDSILDASAFAPVTAFTDHPIAGRLGPEVYGPNAFPTRGQRITTDPLTDRKRGSFNMLLKRSSSGDLLNDNQPRRSSLMSLNVFGRKRSSSRLLQDPVEGPSADAVAASEHEETYHDADERLATNLPEDEEYDGEYRDEPEEAEAQDEDFEGAPTTLLAELQMRKLALKKRTRAAATAFPDGMHATLLELEAVAQVEKRARQKKQTLLAWEDPTAQPAQADHDDEDEDVPLGVLQQRHDFKSRRFDEHRPVGLLEQRNLEDNEPLSYRRARLRGEDPRALAMAQQAAMAASDSPDLQSDRHAAAAEDEEDDDDHPHETLGERMRRLRATQIPNQAAPVSDDFASEMLSQFGGPAAHEPAGQVQRSTTTPHAQPAAPDDGEEETLGQRRRRLQAASVAGEEQGNADNNATRPPAAQRRSMADLLQYHPAAGAGVRTVSHESAYAPARQIRNTAWAMRVNQEAANGMGPYVNNGRYASGAGAGSIAGPLPGNEARQMDMVDRWRQSVM